MKKIIIIAISVLAFPVLVLAKGSLSVVRESGSAIAIEGECLEKVKIELFRKADDDKHVFDKDVSCQDGKFFFSENLSQKNVPEGNYIVAVDGEKSLNMVAVRKDSGEADKILKSTQAENIETADVKFMNALVGLQKSILDMQIWLGETDYPQAVKDSADMILNGLQSAANKITDMMLNVDAGNSDVPASENIAPDGEVFANKIEAQLPAENMQIINSSQSGNQAEVSTNAILSADGLNVEKNEPAAN